MERLDDAARDAKQGHGIRPQRPERSVDGQQQLRHGLDFFEGSHCAKPLREQQSIKCSTCQPMRRGGKYHVSAHEGSTVYRACRLSCIRFACVRMSVFWSRPIAYATWMYFTE